MKKILVGLLLIGASTALAQAVPLLWGQWSFPTMSSNGFTFKVHLVFQANAGTVGEIVECSYGGQTLVSKVSAPADITGNTITVKAAASHSEAGNGFNCDASLVVGTTNYAVSADNKTLTLTQGNQTINLSRDN